MGDIINHPDHYERSAGSIQPIDIIRSCPFDLGNCIKYMCRAGRKGDVEDAVIDLKKARFYFDCAKASFRFDEESYEHWFSKNRHILHCLPVFGIDRNHVFCLENFFNQLDANLYELELKFGVVEK